ncbi:COP9 signalosome complex subunit 7 [Linum perenne]
MEIEQRQATFIGNFVEQASAVVASPAASSSLARIVVESTSHPSVFSFSEILAVPNFDQLQGTEHSTYIDLLKVFAYGTWRDYKAKSSVLPQLTPSQIIKLKQLTVLTLAGRNKVIPYDTLLEELEFSNIRELEDFVVDECVYVGLAKGKMNQLKRCFQVQFAAGRDLMPCELDSVIEMTRSWYVLFTTCMNAIKLMRSKSMFCITVERRSYNYSNHISLETSDNMLAMLEKQIDKANTMEQLAKKHNMDVKANIENAKKNLNFNDHHDVSGSSMFDDEDLYNHEGHFHLKKSARARRGGRNASRFTKM